ncbi:hypothetical protein BDZ91DRAFT_52614 [Kalaharituber pfeilii]|nr:hypothetical protein BDZ91DRAFT_52614 [Kalaharituber pfeilii]
MVSYLIFIQELWWLSPTSRAASPDTLEVRRAHFNEGDSWWFQYDMDSGSLAQVSPNDMDPETGGPKGYTTDSVTTLLYCEKDGYSAIEYHPFRREDENWHHWWSLGFRLNEEDGNRSYTIARHHEPDQRRSITGHSARWFNLFRNTLHHHNAQESRSALPLKGAVSLLWALASFQFSANDLLTRLPATVTRPDFIELPGMTEGNRGEPYVPGKFAGTSTRALAVEIWVPNDHNVRPRPIILL